ncbi:protein FAR-RED ELONGATED HYPOCOTYL 3-like [Rhododendron vialii]|uniref:protein FAR-RED ELONGATED HYPOCOTYL 3-like n=1 Tax=Rhododendron vialii TaxID=182163 RepID=UPI00265F1112|nr:protein FAR-RED ELONGATED HYPOCOTYL 3-like [Rhododendron vialii]
MNAFFDGYVHSNTSLKEFVDQYENALRKKQAYTVEKGNQFRDQVAQKIGCNLTTGPVVNGISQFQIEQDIRVGKKIYIFKTFTFLVHFNEETREAYCNCQFFESKGMVCAHTISVWSKKKLEEVPEKYVLRRWMKNLVRSHTKVKVSYVEWQCEPEFARFDRMLKVFKEAADVAMYSTANTDRMVARLKEIKAENDLDDEECPSNMPTVGDVQNGLERFQDGSITVGDPSKGPRIGRPPEKRKQSMGEQINRKSAQSNKRVQCSRANAKSIPDVEVHTHATGFHEIVTQESRYVTPSQGSVGYIGT